MRINTPERLDLHTQKNSSHRRDEKKMSTCNKFYYFTSSNSIYTKWTGDLVSICWQTKSARLSSELLMLRSFLLLSESPDFPSHREQTPPVLWQNLHPCCDRYDVPIYNIQSQCARKIHERFV